MADSKGVLYKHSHLFYLFIIFKDDLAKPFRNTAHSQDVPHKTYCVRRQSYRASERASDSIWSMKEEAEEEGLEERTAVVAT